jgi:hypothetical protein
MAFIPGDKYLLYHGIQKQSTSIYAGIIMYLFYLVKEWEN